MTFDQFYTIASKYLQLPDKHSYKNGFDNSKLTSDTVVGCHFLYEYIYLGTDHTHRSAVSRSMCLSQECVETTRSSKTTDIYLAGESGDDIRWKEDIAIPMIKYVYNY